MRFKRVALAILAMLLFSVLSGVTVSVILNDEEQVDGSLVGKVGENIFVVTHGANVVIHHDDIYQIRNNDRNVKVGVFSRNDWIDPLYATSPFVPYSESRHGLEIHEDLYHAPRLRIDEVILHEFEDPFMQIHTNTVNEGDEAIVPTKKDMRAAMIAGFIGLLIFIAAIIINW